MSGTNGQNNDVEIEAVRNALRAYQDAHPDAQVDVQRQNNVSIRVRVIDPDFEGLTRGEREPEVWKALEALDDETFQNITMLLLLPPSEVARSFANIEFENPVPSRL
jgi:hypothetical protein